MTTIFQRTAMAAALGGAVLLGGCATGPYYDNGYYGGGYGYTAGYDEPYYAYPGYFGPSVGLGLGYNYYDRDERHGWNDNNNHWRGRDNGNWQGRDDNMRRDDARRNPRIEQDRSGNPIGDGQQDRRGRPEPVEQHDQRG